MRLWRRRRAPTRAPIPCATKAREQAERDLAAHRIEARRVDAMLAGWRQIREENNFRAAIEATMTRRAR